MTGLSRPSPSTFTMVIYGRLIELSRRSVGAEYFLPLVRRPTKFPSGPAPFLHILLHYKDHSLLRACQACHKRRTKKHLARTDSKFDFSSIFEGCFVLPTENRENFTRQQSQSLIFSDSSRPGGYRSFGKVARPEKNCFNIKESSAPWHGGQYISVKSGNTRRFMQSEAYVELHIGANASVRNCAQFIGNFMHIHCSGSIS